MNVTQFVRANDLQAADAVMLRKKIFGMVDHYVVYVGLIDNKHRFVANHRSGVSFVSEQELAKYSEVLEPKHIERFTGTETERRTALQRAFSALGKPYKLISSNCEHFKTWVQKGEWKSEQVKTAGNITAIAGAGLAIGGLATKNKNMTIAGLLLLVGGAIASSFAENDKHE